VVDLAAPDTVKTRCLLRRLPRSQTMGTHTATRSRGLTNRRARCFRDLARIGIDFADVVKSLEEQGLASSSKSWDELIASVTSQLEKASAEVKPISADDHSRRSPTIGGSASRHAR
jgi:transaldolase